MKRSTFLLILTCLEIAGCTQPTSPARRVEGCEDCELMFEGMPETLSWESVLAGAAEAGEQLVVEGVVYQRDGQTPAKNVVIYVYHTDSRGLYSPGPGQTRARRHGHLRGWVRTDETGRYRFVTVRPASYPGTSQPQHIHVIVMESEEKIYWIDDFHFSDDPNLRKARPSGRGGDGILNLSRNPLAVWQGRRDIVLGLNVN